MTNLPILYQNIMFGLPSDLARDAFLWASDRPNMDPMLYRAERFARQVNDIVQVVSPLIEASARIYSASGIGDVKSPDGLMDFVLARHANLEFGGNQKPTYSAKDHPHG